MGGREQGEEQGEEGVGVVVGNIIHATEPRSRRAETPSRTDGPKDILHKPRVPPKDLRHR